MHGQLQVAFGVEQRFGAPRLDVALQSVVAVVSGPGVELECLQFGALGLKPCDVIGAAGGDVVPLHTPSFGLKLPAALVCGQSPPMAVAVAVALALGSDVAVVVVAGIWIPAATRAFKYGRAAEGQVAFIDGG